MVVQMLASVILSLRLPCLVTDKINVYANEEGIGHLSADFWGAIGRRTNRLPLDQLTFQPDRHFVRLLAIDQSHQHFCRDLTHLLAWLSDCSQRGG